MAVSYTHLRDYLLNADERAVHRAYPRHMAAGLFTDHRATLKLLAEATLRGDAVLHWEVRCPHCGHKGPYVDSLSQAKHDHTCAACSGTFVVHLDDEVRVTFSAHPALRPLGAAAADLAFKQHVAEQFPPTTGQELLTVQAFRDWAQNEPLPPHESLEVRHIALWFSDLRGSTALYARRGDPHAFRLVRQHFDYLFEAIDEASGAVVKTLGDSVMATFATGREAMQGALIGHRAMAAFNQRFSLEGDDRLALKVGVHAGPSIAVTLNERLDYFGQTVNLAARIAGLSQAGDVTFSQAVCDDPGVQDLLSAYPVERFEAPVRGLEEPVVVHRLTV